LCANTVYLRRSILVETEIADIRTCIVYSKIGLAIGRKEKKMITAVVNKGKGHILREI